MLSKVSSIEAKRKTKGLWINPEKLKIPSYVCKGKLSFPTVWILTHPDSQEPEHPSE